MRENYSNIKQKSIIDQLSILQFTMSKPYFKYFTFYKVFILRK